MKEDVEYFWTNIFWKWLSYFILRRFLQDSVKFLSDLFPLLEKKKKRKRLKEFRRKRILPPRKFKLNKKDVEKCSVYYKRLFILRTFFPRKMRFKSRYILYCRGFLSREISMIVSSVDNGRTFYDHERKWANFHRGDTIRTDRFTPHFYLLCRRKSAWSCLYTSRFASFRARSTESNKSVATFIYLTSCN